EKVGVRAVSPKTATKATLAPTEPIRIMGGEEYLAAALEGRLVARGDVVSVPVMGRRFEFLVQSFSPSAEAAEITSATKVRISEKPAKAVETSVPRVSYEDIGGLRDEVGKVREMIELPLRHPELFERLGVEAPKGVLLHGPPGTGKTLLAKAVASETNANFYSISGPEIMSTFDREIEIGIPDRDGRLEILQVHARNVPLAKDVDLKALADITHGYVGADLSALVKEAAMRSLRRALPAIDLEVEEIPVEALKKLEVTREDFLSAFREMEPSTLREVLIETPNVHWGDIGGLDAAKQELREAVEWPLKYARLFTQAGAKPPKGVLLYGPP